MMQWNAYRVAVLKSRIMFRLKGHQSSTYDINWFNNSDPKVGLGGVSVKTA